MNIGPEIYFSVIIGIYWILVWQWVIKKKSSINLENCDKAKVSVLLAVRNESDNILRCLTALANVEFNKSNIEILIGNDNSEDDTAILIKEFIEDKPQFKLYHITEQLNGLKGKANVLAQLAHRAKGDYFFITDADIEVNPKWISALLSHVTSDTGIVTGYTHIKGDHLLAKLQALDWTFAQALMKVFFDSDKPITTMGNNMLVTRDAYFKTGGYEHIPFSLTEDYALFEQVQKNNYACIQTFDENVKVFSLALNTIPDIILQRKRWTLGAVTNFPWYLSILLVIQFMYWPMVFYIATFSIQYTLTAILIKWVVQSILFFLVMRSIKERLHLTSLLLIDFYILIISWGTLFSIIQSRKVIWKNRTYQV